MYNFKGAIFDLDGTLLDSMGVWEQIDIDCLAKRGIEVPKDYMEIITPMVFQEVAVYTKERFNLEESPEEIINEWFNMAKYEYSHNIKLKPYTKDYLLKLKSLGIKICAATSGSEYLFKDCLKNNGIYELFDFICTTADVGKGKTSPDIYIFAAENMGLKPAECIVFEDIPEAVISAAQAGTVVVGVYDQYAEHRSGLMKEKAHLYISDFSEAPLPYKENCIEI